MCMNAVFTYYPRMHIHETGDTVNEVKRCAFVSTASFHRHSGWCPPLPRFPTVHYAYSMEALLKGQRRIHAACDSRGVRN